MFEGADAVQADGELDQDDAESSTMASIILRVLGWRFLGRKIYFADLGDASTMWVTCSPNSWRTSTVVTEVSSTES